MDKKKTIIICSIVTAIVIIAVAIFCIARCGKKNDTTKETTATKYIEITDKAGKVVETKKVIIKGKNGEETVIVEDVNDSFDSGDGDDIGDLVGDSDQKSDSKVGKKTNKKSSNSSNKKSGKSSASNSSDKKSDDGSVTTKSNDSKKDSGDSSDDKKKDDKQETTKKKDDDKKPETTKKHQSNYDVKDKDDDQGFGKLIG